MKLKSILESLLKELGEGTAKPFKWKREENIDTFLKIMKEFPGEKTANRKFIYEAQSDKATYAIIMTNLISKKESRILHLPGAEVPRSKGPKWEMITAVSFNIKGVEAETETNLNEVYRLMATVIACLQDYITAVESDGEIEINKIYVYPKADQPGQESSIESKRGRIYLAYIKKNIAKLPGSWTAYQTDRGVEIRRGDWTGGDIVAKTGEDIIKEFGEGTAQPYKWNRKVKYVGSLGNYESVGYIFETEDGIKYEATINKGDGYEKKGKGREEETMDYMVAFGILTTKIDRSGWKDDIIDYDITSKTGKTGNLFRVMATMVQIIKNELDIDYKNKELAGRTRRIYMSPTKATDERGKPIATDMRRANLYMAFIKKQMPNAIVKMDSEGEDMKIIIPWKEEK